MNHKNTTYTIGQIAKKTGLTAKMIRDYERHGLLGAVTRSESGYRLFNHNDLQTLYFIRQARKLGFSLVQLQEILQLLHNKASSSAEVKYMAFKHIESIMERASILLVMVDTLIE